MKRSNTTFWLFVAFAFFFVSILAFLYQKNLTQETRLSDIAPTAVPTSTNWQIYENKKHGFSLQYPSNLKPVETKSWMYDSVQVGKQLEIVVVNPVTETAKNYVQGILNTENDDKISSVQLTPIQTTSVSGQQAYFYDKIQPNLTERHLYLDTKGAIIQINQSGFDNITSQILSTFKFANNEDESSVVTYTSKKFGISFKYTNEISGNEIKVKEDGNRIYVYLSNADYKTGQFVEIFDKNPGDTIENAIKIKFIADKDPKLCYVEKDTSPNGSQKAQIVYPVGENDGLKEMLDKNAYCSERYSRSNGLSYFQMFNDHPEKFLYFSIGQYGIPGDNENNGWQDTFKFL